MKFLTRSHVMRRVGRRVRHMRQNFALSQARLAARIELSRTQIVNIEAGRSDVPVTTLMRIARGIGCDAKDLLP